MKHGDKNMRHSLEYWLDIHEVDNDTRIIVGN
jgi:hypothetical protein